MSRKFEKGAIKYPFVAVPKELLASMQWQALPDSAKTLAIDLANQYTGGNNGRISTAFTAMQKCGWTSKSKLAKAKAALLQSDFVILTRKGHPPRTSEWVGFTWWPLNWQQSMDIKQSGWPYLNFINLPLHDPNNGREKMRKAAPCVSRNPGRSRHKSPSGHPESGEMGQLE